MSRYLKGTTCWWTVWRIRLLRKTWALHKTLLWNSLLVSDRSVRNKSGSERRYSNKLPAKNNKKESKSMCRTNKRLRKPNYRLSCVSNVKLMSLNDLKPLIVQSRSDCSLGLKELKTTQYPLVIFRLLTCSEAPAASKHPRVPRRCTTGMGGIRQNWTCKLKTLCSIRTITKASKTRILAAEVKVSPQSLQ